MLFEDGDGGVRSLPTAWTTIAGTDPFVMLSAGRSFFRIEDLLLLVTLVAKVTTSLGRCKGDSAVSVKRNTSDTQRHDGR